MSEPPERRATVHRPRNSARRHRLAVASEFDRVFRQGQRSSDRLFTILFVENSLAEPRLGFAISRRNVRRAVGRNRIRRLVRESFRSHLAQLPELDFVVMAKPAAAAAVNPEIFASLRRHWARAGQSPVTGRTREV